MFFHSSQEPYQTDSQMLHFRKYAMNFGDQNICKIVKFSERIQTFSYKCPNLKIN